MLIECKIKRPRGSRVTLDGEEYIFFPTKEYPGNPHLCRVDDERHIARFLSIPEGYREWVPPEERLKRPAPKPADDKAAQQPAQPDQPPQPKPSGVDLTTLSDEALARLSVSEVTDWGKRLGVNPNNKQAIQQFATRYGFDLDARKNETNMLKELAGVFRESGKKPKLLGD